MNMIEHDFEQHTDDWYNIRLGKITASDFHILMGNSSTKDSILHKKAAERLTNKACDHDAYKNHHMDRGNKLEPEARNLYEVVNHCEVREVGFVTLGDYLGCSPDGLIGSDGGVEIKSKDNHTFLKSVTKNWIEPAHRTQCQVSMYITNRQWWDYVLYNENFSNPIYTIKIFRDEKFIDDIKKTINECESKINKIINQYKSVMTWNSNTEQ